MEGNLILISATVINFPSLEHIQLINFFLQMSSRHLKKVQKNLSIILEEEENNIDNVEPKKASFNPFSFLKVGAKVIIFL